jgi:hypothetical protein
MTVHLAGSQSNKGCRTWSVAIGKRFMNFFLLPTMTQLKTMMTAKLCATQTTTKPKHDPHPFIADRHPATGWRFLFSLKTSSNGGD